MENNKALATLNNTSLSTALNTSLSDYGYSTSRLDRDENGDILVTVKDADNKGETLVTPIHMNDSAVSTLDSFAAFMDFDKLSTLFKCYHVWHAAPIAKDNGFRSVGEFLSMNFGLKAGTINQYYRIAAKCLDCTGDKPVFKYEWLKGVAVTNINQCLSLMDKCDSMEDFKAKYIDTEMLHLRKPLSQLKAEIDVIAGKTDKQAKQASEAGEASATEASKPASNTVSIETAWSMVIEYLTANTGMSKELQKAIKTIDTYVGSEATEA